LFIITIITINGTACAQQAFAYSDRMLMLSWYRLVSKSKPQHKLAILLNFRENTLINFHWLWNQVFCLNSAGAHWLNFFSNLNIIENAWCSQREHIRYSDLFLIFISFYSKPHIFHCNWITVSIQSICSQYVNKIYPSNAAQFISQSSLSCKYKNTEMGDEYQII